MFPAGFEPATLRVWGARDNHYTTETTLTGSDGFKSCSGSGEYFMGLSIGTSLTSGLVAQWITRLTTDQKIAGSNPAEIEILFFFIKVTNIQKRNVPRRRLKKYDWK